MMLFCERLEVYMMSDSPFHPLTSESDWADALSHSEDELVVVYKHSSACSVSTKANREMSKLAKQFPVPIYKVVVQNNRAISDTIADTLDIRHETPQAIVLQDGSPLFDTSHFNVTVDTLREELRRVAITND